MPDECEVCGRRYATYSEGHTPNSEACIANQMHDLREELAHARKSQPKEGVNQTLLDACTMAIGYVSAVGGTETDTFATLESAIRAAESAAVPSMEAKIEVLKYAASLCESKNLSFKNEGYRAACDDIKTCLLASIERLEAGEQMEATASVAARKEGGK